MSEILYAKYTDYRNRRFRLLTRIIEQDDGTRIVTKESADGADAAQHLESIAWARGALEALYGDTLSICPCSYADDRVTFPYIPGTSYQHTLNRAVSSGNDGKMRDAFGAYAALLEGGDRNIVPFTASDAFREVFSDVIVAEGTPALGLSNLDASGDNLIIAEPSKKLTLVDYEWVMSFPIPRDFVVYRNLRVMHEKHWSNQIRLDTLLRMCGVATSLSALQQMDEAFTRYITYEPDGSPSWARILQEHERRFVPRSDLFRRTEHYVFLDTGKGFSETEKLAFPARGSSMNVTVDVVGVSAIRLDPYGGARCTLRDLHCTTDTGVELSMQPAHAAAEGDALILDSPANLHAEIPPGTQSIEIRAQSSVLEDENSTHEDPGALAVERSRVRDLTDAVRGRDRVISELQTALKAEQEARLLAERELGGARGESEQLRSAIDEIYNSKSWRYTQWLRNMRSAKPKGG